MAKKLSEMSGMPNVGGALSGWTLAITLIVIRQDIVDGFVKEIKKAIKFMGVIQPLSPRKIELKPEGQRAWKWLQIHCKEGALKLKPGDKIEWGNELFKLMADNDFYLNGFVEYHVVKDYSEAK